MDRARARPARDTATIAAATLFVGAIAYANGDLP
ncbi:hypothetical protein BKA00_004287 [Actinomadura coerulea]|uniref:Uncharacterized protein n=1 Tax=Actinomadura coerulea TaxID=46159 RepID=A0A7X0G0Y2_9ACTN|nr:hypothetical protein [Actinomadura coerulea]